MWIQHVFITEIRSCPACTFYLRIGKVRPIKMIENKTLCCAILHHNLQVGLEAFILVRRGIWLQFPNSFGQELFKRRRKKESKKGITKISSCINKFKPNLCHFYRNVKQINKM